MGHVVFMPPSKINVVSYRFFFFQAEDGIRYLTVTGVQTCALPICPCARRGHRGDAARSRLDESARPRQADGRPPRRAGVGEADARLAAHAPAPARIPRVWSSTAQVDRLHAVVAQAPEAPAARRNRTACGPRRYPRLDARDGA